MSGLTHFCNIKESDDGKIYTITQTLQTFYKITALLHCSIQQTIQQHPNEEVWVVLRFKERVDDTFAFSNILIRHPEAGPADSSVILSQEDDVLTLTLTADVFNTTWIQMARRNIHRINEGKIAAIVKLVVNVPTGMLKFSVHSLMS